MDRFNLRQLRYFSALAQFLHFGRAADACRVTQPALSMQIRELEQTLGIALIERSGRGTRLTPFGERAIGAVNSILQGLDDLDSLARAARGNLVGRMRLGMIPTIAPYLFPALIAKARGEYPGLDILLREAVTARLVEELESGKIDAAILALPVEDPRLASVMILRETFLLVRPKSHARKPVPDAQALKDMPILLLDDGHCFRTQALAYCGLGAGIGRNAFGAQSLSTLVRMVAAGQGVTLIPEMAKEVETRGTDVTVQRLRDPQPERMIGLIWRKANPMAGQFLGFADMAKAAAQSANSI
jgi:LysR family hydrogen peroxide-inducible transcriptional activator